jgi:creatinine amidohydrolase
MHELSWDEIAAQLARDDVALLPIGATEQHGRHAPLLVDTGLAVQMAEAAAKEADCLVAPPLHYGWSHGHMAFPGTLNLRAETLTAAAADVSGCLVRHGARRVVLVSGGRSANLPPVEIAAVTLRLATGALLAVADCGLLAREEVAALSEGGPSTIGHAGETETAMALARYPHLVDMARAPGRFVA